MTNDKLTQVNTSPVVLSFSASTKASVPLEPTTTQGDLALLGTIQALSSMTEELAPTTAQDTTAEYTAPPADETTGYGTSPGDELSHKGLIGGSALSMASLSLIDLEKNLLKISLNSINQSILSNQEMSATALNQYNALLDAAEDSYNATMQEAYSQWTSCATTGMSATAALGMGGVALKQMSESAAEMKSLKAQQSYFQKDERNPTAPIRPDHEPIGIENHDIQNPANQRAFKADLEANKGKLSAQLQRTHGLDENGKNVDGEVDLDFAIAKYQYNTDKIAAIEAAMQAAPAPGRLDNPTERTYAQYFTGRSRVYSLKGDIANEDGTFREVNYGKFDIHNDEIAQYGLRRAAHNMSNEAVKGAQGRLEEFHTTAKDTYDKAHMLISQGIPTFREVMSSIENGVKGLFTERKADFDQSAAEENAAASLYKSASDQLSALQSTWSSLNSKYYDQALSLLPNQMAALVKANSAN